MKNHLFDSVTRVNLMYGLVSFGAVFYSTLWIPFALDVFKQDWATLAKISSMLWIGTVVGEIPTGILTDRWGARKAILAYTGLSLAAAVITFAAPAAHPLFSVAHFIQGFALSFLTGIFSLRLKEEQRVSKLVIDYKKAVTQGAAFRAVMSVLGIGLAWWLLRAFGSSLAFPVSILTWALIGGAASQLWSALPIGKAPSSMKEVLKIGPAIYRNNAAFRDLSLARVGVDLGSAALIEYAISLVAPDLSEGSGRYLVFSVLFAAIRLFSSRAVALVNSAVAPYAFLLTIMAGTGLLAPSPFLGMVIAGLFFLLFYIDYQVHSEALEALEEEGASTAMSFQGLTMSFTSALALYLHGCFIPYFGKAGSMLMLLVVGTSIGAAFYASARKRATA